MSVLLTPLERWKDGVPLSRSGTTGAQDSTHILSLRGLDRRLEFSSFAERVFRRIGARKREHVIVLLIFTIGQFHLELDYLFRTSGRGCWIEL